MHIVRRDSLRATLRNTLAFHANAASLGLRGRLGAVRATRAGLAACVAAFNARRVVLTVTAGRTGTDTVSHLLGHLPDTRAAHEPDPNHRFVLARVQHDPRAAARFFWYLQAPALIARGPRNVVESSHLFCKGFFEPCIAAGFRPALLMLHRDTRTTALSHLRKRSVPGRTGAGHRYLLAPGDHPYLGIDRPGDLTDYQLCYWYCLEIELRQQLYGQIAETLGLTVAHLDTPDLSDMDRLVATCAALGLATPPTARRALDGAGIDRPRNAGRTEGRTGPGIDFDREEAAVRARLHAPAPLAAVQARIDRARAWLP